MEKNTGWAVAGKNHKWHYFKNNVSFCKNFVFYIDYIFEKKHNGYNICKTCERLKNDHNNTYKKYKKMD